MLFWSRKFLKIQTNCAENLVVTLYKLICEVNLALQLVDKRVDWKFLEKILTEEQKE